MPRKRSGNADIMLQAMVSVDQAASVRALAEYHGETESSAIRRIINGYRQAFDITAHPMPETTEALALLRDMAIALARIDAHITSGLMPDAHLRKEVTGLRARWGAIGERNEERRKAFIGPEPEHLKDRHDEPLKVKRPWRGFYPTDKPTTHRMERYPDDPAASDLDAGRFPDKDAPVAWEPMTDETYDPTKEG